MNATKKLNSPLVNILKGISTIAILKEGDLVEGLFLEKIQKAAYFGLGPVGTGIVFGVEFANASDVLKNLKPGEKVSAKVVDPENEDGYVELSLAEAGIQKSWEAVKNLKERGDIITVKIAGANSGGLLTEVEGLKAFLPVSQLATEHYPRVEDGDRGKILEGLRKLVGSELKAKVIDFKPRAMKIILSERESVEENTKELLTKYGEGQTVDG